MSASDDQPATVPPPAGEDDAYSAATRVGTMPADLLAKLRAEGLLPEEETEEPTRLAPQPLLPEEAVPSPPPPAPVPPSDGKVPVLYSTAPPADGQAMASPAVGQAPPPAFRSPLEDAPPPSSLQAYETSPVMETPVAFTASPQAPLGAPENGPSGAVDEVPAFSRRLSKGQVIVFLVVAGLLAVVGLLFMLALSSQPG